MTTTTSNAFISPYKIQRSGKLALPVGTWALIYDKNTAKFLSKISGDIRFKISSDGGESAKSFRHFEKVLLQLSKQESKKGPVEGICVLGGGAVGDLGAFVASLYRRGLRLVLVPTTYLSVIDSAFGGKTAINFAEAKNQIGSFYPAEKVLIHSSFLPADSRLIRDAFAEILKMAILEGALWKKLKKVKKTSSKAFWGLAQATIQAKLKIVKKDPKEKLGIRNLLNLGHTLGHVFEKLSRLTHGEAVALGLFYELEVFYLIGKISEDDYLDILDVWERFFNFEALSSSLGKRHSLRKARSLLLKDKKAKGSYVKTPVVYKAGKVKVEKIPLDVFLRFLSLQGIVR